MKKSFLAAISGILAGAALLVCAGPASAHDRVDFGISIGVPLAYVAPAPVVYSGYAPAVRVEAPYYYRDSGYYYQGYRGGDHDGWRDHDGYRYHEGWRGHDHDGWYGRDHDGWRGGEHGEWRGERH